MTRQDLYFCRKTALALMSIRKRIFELRSSASSVSGLCYGDSPKTRGEPIPAQQRYVEKLEKLYAEAFRLEQLQRENWEKLPRAALTRLQKQLVYGYYFQGLSWEEVNEKCRVSRDQSKYQVRKALEKVLKNA